MPEIRVLVVDDHPLFRQGVIFTLSRHPDIEVVAEGASGREAVALAKQFRPDVILLDVTMPEGDGLSAAAQIAQIAPEARIIMLTASEDADDLLTAMKVGARGYVVKGVGAVEVVDAVLTVANDGAYITPKMAGNLLSEMSRSPRADDPLDELTERERQVLELVAQGLTNREVGDALGLAEKTVKHYVTSVLQKLNVRSRVEAALLAQRYGLGQ